MTQNERDLLILLATIIGPSSNRWHEVRDLLTEVKNQKGVA